MENRFCEALLLSFLPSKRLICLIGSRYVLGRHGCCVYGCTYIDKAFSGKPAASAAERAEGGTRGVDYRVVDYLGARWDSEIGFLVVRLCAEYRAIDGSHYCHPEWRVSDRVATTRPNGLCWQEVPAARA